MITFKPYSVGLIVAVLLGLSGCGGATRSGGAATVPASTAAPTPASANATRYRIALVLGKTTDPFYTSMKCGAQAKAAELGDVDLTVEGAPDWNPQLQVPIIERLVAGKVQAIAIVVNDGKALYQPLKAAHDAGIKILGVDTRLDDTGFEVTNIGSDNYRLGVEAALTLAKLIGDKGTVLTVPATKGVASVEERVQGFVEEITASHPNITLVSTEPIPSSSSMDVRLAAYGAAFAAHPEIVGVYATSTDLSEGAAAAIKALPAERQKRVSLVSFDASPTLAEALRAGQLQALVAQKPGEMGAQAVDLARRALRGERVEKLIPTGGVGLTQQNVDMPEFSKYVYQSSCP